MSRKRLRFLIAVLIVAGAFGAAALFTRDYAENPDPAALFKVQAAKVTADHQHYWLEIHLKKSADADHDLQKLVQLQTAFAKNQMAAKTTFSGNPLEGFNEMWLKFWLEKEDLEGKISLSINDGSLTIKETIGQPKLKSEVTVFQTTDWKTK